VDKTKEIIPIKHIDKKLKGFRQIYIKEKNNFIKEKNNYT